VLICSTSYICFTSCLLFSSVPFHSFSFYFLLFLFTILPPSFLPFLPFNTRSLYIAQVGLELIMQPMLASNSQSSSSHFPSTCNYICAPAIYSLSHISFFIKGCSMAKNKICLVLVSNPNSCQTEIDSGLPQGYHPITEITRQSSSYKIYKHFMNFNTNLFNHYLSYCIDLPFSPN
jgi:hypothetical protein